MTVFEVWAPLAEKVELDLGDRRRLMARGEETGWWTLDADDVGAGTDYSFRLDGGPPRPDPRSRRQPFGVHGPSRVVDSGAFGWTDGGWRGRPLSGSVVYELHIGTFTSEGTFDAAVGKLDHLVGLGVDFVEVMPVASFPGRHGWGYDGVALWAVHEAYGGPDAFRRFIDACHGRGLAVVLDVVYNHLGPSGNYLGEFGPYFNSAHQTPWGPAVNLDGAGSDEVRSFIVGNALYWLRDLHLDGLRLDAVHALVDTRAVNVLEELSGAVDRLSDELGRPLCLIAESDRNDPRTVTARAEGGLGVHAQWDDDFHHGLHSALTGETQGYYADFASLGALAKTLVSVFFHNGTYSSFRGRHHGRPVDPALGADRFVVFLQNHDQIGNRAEGDRIGASLSEGLARVGAALLLTSPFTPQLFMGEEWGAGTPWQYFTDHQEPELAQAVRDGRRAEFARYGWPPDLIPDPQAESTFERSRLDWSEVEEEGETRAEGEESGEREKRGAGEGAVARHRGLLEWYRALIALRRSRPELRDPDLGRVGVAYDDSERWVVVRRGDLCVAANLGSNARSIPLEGVGSLSEVLLASAPGVEIVGGRAGEGLFSGSSAGGQAVRLPPESVAVLA